VIEGKRVAVVVPAFNEEKLLPETLAGIPGFVDRIVVVDDASTDGTVGRAHAAAAGDPRIAVVARERNGGVGAAIVTGYERALEEEVDAVA
jgi:glycosyltransferase involved in cell wall biosynthesis